MYSGIIRDISERGRMEFRIKLDIPDLPQTGDLLVVPEEDAAQVINADGFQRLAAPPHHFEVRTIDGAKWVIARRHADSGASRSGSCCAWRALDVRDAPC